MRSIFTINNEGVFIVNFEHISNLFLVFLLLTLNKPVLGGSESQNLYLIFIDHRFLISGIWVDVVLEMVQ